PTSAATRRCGRIVASVRSRNVVLPAPGLETRLVTKRWADRNRSRSAAAATSFFFRMFLRTSTIRGSIHDLQPGQFQFAARRPLDLQSRAGNRGIRSRDLEGKCQRLGGDAGLWAHANPYAANGHVMAESGQLVAHGVDEA